MTSQQKQHQYQSHVNRKCRLAFYLSIGLLLSLSLLKMLFSNRASNWGHTLDQIKYQTTQIRRENLHLQSQLAAQAGGLTQLAAQAQQAGFTDKPAIKYFTPGVEVAQKLP